MWKCGNVKIINSKIPAGKQILSFTFHTFSHSHIFTFSHSHISTFSHFHISTFELHFPIKKPEFLQHILQHFNANAAHIKFTVSRFNV